MKRIIKIFSRFLGGREDAELTYLKNEGLRIGKNLRNHSKYAFDSLFPWLISVGDNVCISSNVKILAHDTSTEYVNGLTKIGIVEIGDNVYIGYNTIILCDVRIGSNVIIGAGSVVTKDIPEGTVYAGNPARFICNIEDFKEKHSKRQGEYYVYEGPLDIWGKKENADKVKMREELQEHFGYMK